MATEPLIFVFSPARTVDAGDALAVSVSRDTVAAMVDSILTHPSTFLSRQHCADWIAAYIDRSKTYTPNTVACAHCCTTALMLVHHTEGNFDVVAEVAALVIWLEQAPGEPLTVRLQEYDREHLSELLVPLRAAGNEPRDLSAEIRALN